MLLCKCCTIYWFSLFVVNQDFCPEYDPVDQTIQKDLATLCNSTFSRNYYNSSDIYFCKYTHFHSVHPLRIINTRDIKKQINIQTDLNQIL